MRRRTKAAITTLLALSACDSGPRVAAPEPIAPALAARLYLSDCAICHGEHGDGRGPRRGSLHDKPPDFRRAAWRDGTSLAGVQDAIRNGKPGTDMPAWRTLDDAEVAGLARFVWAFGEADAREPDALGPDAH